MTDERMDEPHREAHDAQTEPPGEHGQHGQHGEHGERHAVAIDGATKADAVTRLRRIEGQVRGLQRMVEDERYCADVLAQVASVQQALRSVGRLLMRNHLEHCVTHALRSGDALEAERSYQEILDLMYRHAR